MLQMDFKQPAFFETRVRWSWVWLVGLLGLSGESCVTIKRGTIDSKRPPASVVAPLRAKVESRLVTPELTMVFRASRFANLFYHLNCLSGVARCSRAAFEHLWRSQLGLSPQEETTLMRWKSVQLKYRGVIERSDDEPLPEVGLPVPGVGRQIQTRLALAGFLAADVTQYLERAALLVDRDDVGVLRDVLRVFEPRFEKHWRQVVEGLETQAQRFSSAAQAGGIISLTSKVVSFYQSQLPAGAEMYLELIARPEGAPPTHAEQIEALSVIECLAGERVEDRLDVVLHEVFHYFYSTAPTSFKVQLANRFVASRSKRNIAAFALLNESLATAFGNGMVLRALKPEVYQQRLHFPSGFYADADIDAVAKQLLPRLDDDLRAGKHLYDAQFVDQYIETVTEALPQGPRWMTEFKFFTAAFDPAFRASLDVLTRAIAAGSVAAFDSLVYQESGEFLAERPHWPKVFLAKRSQVQLLEKWKGLFSASELRALKLLSDSRPTSAVVLRRDQKPAILVLLAPDEHAMQALVTRLTKVEGPAEGLLIH
jgi:hypothetical protein